MGEWISGRNHGSHVYRTPVHYYFTLTLHVSRTNFVKCKFEPCIKNKKQNFSLKVFTYLSCDLQSLILRDVGFKVVNISRMWIACCDAKRNYVQVLTTEGMFPRFFCRRMLILLIISLIRVLTRCGLWCG